MDRITSLAANPPTREILVRQSNPASRDKCSRDVPRRPAPLYPALGQLACRRPGGKDRRQCRNSQAGLFRPPDLVRSPAQRLPDPRTPHETGRPHDRTKPHAAGQVGKFWSVSLGKTSPFALQAIRHLVASILSDSHKASPRQIQAFLGHQRIDTTENYLHEFRPMDDVAAILEDENRTTNSTNFRTK